MLRSNVTKSLAAVISFFAAYAATAQEVRICRRALRPILSIFPLAATRWMLKTRPKYATWPD
jgi:hypothetical protein